MWPRPRWRWRCDRPEMSSRWATVQRAIGRWRGACESCRSSAYCWRPLAGMSGPSWPPCSLNGPWYECRRIGHDRSQWPWAGSPRPTRSTAMLAHLAQVTDTPPTPQETPQQQRLQALVQRRGQVVQQRDDERRRLQQVQGQPLVMASLKRQLRGLQTEIVLLDKAIAQAVAEADSERSAQLRAVPGI